jgi:ferrous iron transport protein B
MATRTIENRKDRLATIFVAPFMSCSARLPVYFLLIGTFFGGYSALVRGGLMLSLYLLGIVAAVGTAFLFRRTMLKGAATSFILELPTYKPPQVSQVARVVGRNTWQFLTKAGTTIFCLSVILWALAYYPRLPKAEADAAAARVHADVEGQVAALLAKPLNPISDGKNDFGPESAYQSARQPASALSAGPGQIGQIGQAPFIAPNSEIANDPKARKGYAERLRNDQLESLRKSGEEQADKAVASAQLRYSLAGRFGHLLEPAIKPLGYDWKMGVGLVSAFAAREVFVSTMAITYSAGSEDDTADLSTAMRQDRYADGRPVWTPAVALSLLVWFVLAMQCMSTLAIVRRETGGWGWPVFMIVYMNALAYVTAFGVYQIAARMLT